MWSKPPLRILAPLSLLVAACPVVALPLVALAPPAEVQARTAEPQLRILLKEGSSLEIAASEAPLRIADGRGRELLQLQPGTGLRLSATATALRTEPLTAGSAQPLRSLPLAELWIEPMVSPQASRDRSGAIEAAPFLLQSKAYRGRLQLLSSGSRLQAINVIGIESYLPSVVGSEMPASWPLEALRAQAVAARTYALQQRRPKDPFDLKATVASQMYKGVEAETSSTREAVASTRSQVLLHGNALINAVFHSSSGGATENSGDLWRQQLPYLVSVPDFDDTSPVSHWQLRLEPEQLRKAFPETGGVNRIEVVSTTGSGRVRQARISGPAGSLLVTGADLRSRLGLRSTLVRFELLQPEIAALPVMPPPSPVTSASRVTSDGEVPVDSASGNPAGPQMIPVMPALPLQVPQPSIVATGRGFGHGVGMSQWGAFGMARQGSSYDQILRHYYQGAELRPLPQ
ncbi:SpoIID/LytB domain-containing protein [Synechococcus sp. CS-1328]|uniref:SpoIID/LytB domain-containing protein n=1 Tax=Synechococcus sp. CS-1328 TaxID=2847976 RepID=UPI00223C39E6|nr:SpoIID/LytB domain-containing protein [Synechococcus sp. CS-1328]MCT0225775.1 SpoIID/LytB domain-containing protein [Synechococcus sp. CS-1328]